MKLTRAIPYSIRFKFLDFWKGIFTRNFLIQRKLRRHLRDQNKRWERGCTNGYFYQGIEELAITGAKPTGFRFFQYEVNDILKGAAVLDIGSNCGFVAIYCAKTAKNVTAVEINPYLNRIAHDAAKYLRLTNIEIVEEDFSNFHCSKKFDVVLSFSNHHTIDGRLDMGFENYIKKLVALLKPNGYLLFESHNVFAEGKGGVGDDGDMEKKVAIMNKYFNIKRYKMIRCFLEHAVEDLDKLFIVAQRSNNPTMIRFSLRDTIDRYEY